MADASPENGDHQSAAKTAWSDAEQSFLKAIEHGSKHKERLYRFIAVARLERGDILGAQKTLVRSLEEDPDEMKTWQLLLQSCQMTGDHDVVLTTLDWGIELLGGSRSDELCTLRLLRARVLHDHYGDEARAEEECLQVVEEYPERVDAWAAFHSLTSSTGREEVFNACFLRVITEKHADQNVNPLLQAVYLGLSDGGAGVDRGVRALAKILDDYDRTGTSGGRVPEMITLGCRCARHTRTAGVSLTNDCRVGIL